VIHFQRPGSVIAYYQQVGRAGRAVDEAYGVLLSGREDDEIQDYFIRSAFPPAEVMSRVLRAVEQTSGTTVNELMSQMNYRRGVIDKALKLMEVDGAVIRDGTKYIRTPNAWHPDQMHSEQVTKHRRDELEEIKRYVDYSGCLMEFLARALDDPWPSSCGKCMNCAGATQRQGIPPSRVYQAVQFLRGDDVSFDARKQWPTAALDEVQRIMPVAVTVTTQGRPSTRIPAELHLEQGRALSIYGDAGWGQSVQAGKYQTRYFNDELVQAAARLILDRWRPEPFPQWVTCVPSNRQPTLVSDFAERLAATLNLPFVAAVRKTRDTEPQKMMENSTQQVRNLLGAFSVERDILKAPVLLTDDVIDSGWTLSVVGILLRIGGSGPVFPFALARATAGDS
jgi:ATP-dependent DNA helicase RecQ